jgi:CRISPR-associated protein Cas2
MPLTVVVTRDVEARYRGFLGSTMLEVAPTVYVHPRLSTGVRERIWAVLADWYATLQRGAVVLVWRDPMELGGLGIRVLGLPPRKLHEIDGLFTVRREL